PGIVSTHKMHRELRRNQSCLFSIARLLAGPYLLMQAYPVPSGHARIHHLMIQGMEELIARRDRPVGPRLRPTGPDEPPLAGQGRTARFECLRGLRHTRRHGGPRKRAPRPTGRFPERLVRLPPLLELLLPLL